VWHKKFNDDFAAAFPQHRATDSEYSTGTDYYPKLQTALATNSVPDYLFRNNGNDLPTLWDQGLLAPLNDVIDDIYKLAGGKDKFSQATVDRLYRPERRRVRRSICWGPARLVVPTGPAAAGGD